MEKNSLIEINQVCSNCHVEESFIQSLHELGHIELIVQNNDHYIAEMQLKQLESLIFFHTELQINIEGIDAIAHLLKKIESLQNDLTVVRNKLNFYVSD